MEFWSKILDTSDFPPRWRCGNWTEAHGWLHICSDLAIWSAYFAIPCVLIYFFLSRRDLPFRKIFFLFGAFILLCGTTHLMEAIIFWWPGYRLAGLIKLLTAVVSWGTVFVLVGVVPSVMAMRSPEELEREIDARKSAEDALQKANAELESRVLARTTELTAANESLHSEREWFSTTLASIGDAVIATDFDSRIKFLNSVAVKLTGWTQQEAIGRPLTDVFRIINEYTRDTVEDPTQRALQEGVIVGLANHTLLIAKDGTERPIDDSAAPIKNSRGTAVGAVLVFRDVTQRRHLERENEDRLAAARFLASIVESSEDAIYSKSLEGVLQSWNAAAERLFGYNAQEAIGKPISLIVPPECLEEEAAILARLRRGERVDHFETTRLSRDQQRVPVSLTMSTIRDEVGRVVGVSTITRDITERRRWERQIQELMTELKAADRRKDQFLATLAHEIRNPLAPIRMGLEVMKIAKDDAATVDNVRDTMERQVQQLVHLVDDLLDISRITQGKYQLKKSRVEVAELVHNALETIQPLLSGSNHALNISLPEQPIFLHADPHRLTQVLSNLLNNAVKFTPPGGRISLVVERDHGEAVVRVKDSGIGIPADKLNLIFEMFVQIDSSPAQSTSGLGIGLTLVKTLVEMHQGTIEVHSGGSHQGSEFTVRLPIHEAASAGEDRAIETSAQTPVPRRVLVVDDNQAAAHTLSMLIKILGHEVRTAADGQQAIEIAEQFRPDVVLMDLGMPKVNGYEAARFIRQQPWGETIRLVALTGWGQEEDKRRTQEAGFHDHLVKPAEPADLQRIFANLPNRR